MAMVVKPGVGAPFLAAETASVRFGARHSSLSKSELDVLS